MRRNCIEPPWNGNGDRMVGGRFCCGPATVILHLLFNRKLWSSCKSLALRIILYIKRTVLSQFYIKNKIIELTLKFFFPLTRIVDDFTILFLLLPLELLLESWRIESFRSLLTSHMIDFQNCASSSYKFEYKYKHISSFLFFLHIQLWLQSNNLR